MPKKEDINKMDKPSTAKAKITAFLSLFHTKAVDITRLYILPYKWEYLFGGILVLLILFSEMYYDFFATFRNGINFWYALSEGHPLSFYSYAASIPGATPNRTILCGAAYDFTIYVFFAVWNLPAWLYERLSGNYAESCFLFLAWGKLMLPFVSIITARGMKKILEFITGDDQDTAAMLYAYSFSGILIMSAYFIGQYDIIGVMFAIYGVFYFLKKDYKRFYLYFGAAISCKYFALLLFVCLVLLYEKRVLYIIRDIFLGCYLVIIEKLLFSFGRSYDSIHAAAEQTAVTVSQTTTAAAPAGLTGEIVGTNLLASRFQYLFHLKAFMGVDVISIFMFLLALIWVYCYLQKREESYQFYYKVIYIAFCVNTVFIIYTASTPYWAVLIVPYMILMIYCRSENRKLNLLLEIIATGSFIVWHFAREPYLFPSENCEGMLLYYLLGKPYFYCQGLSHAMSYLFENSILSTPINMLRSVYYTCILILLIINFPAFQQNRREYLHVPEEVGMRGVLAFRTICMTGVLLLPLVGYVIQVICSGYLSNLQTDSQILKEVVPFFLQ